MDFTFTEQQRMMAGACRELLDDICSPGATRLAAEGRSDAGAERWARLSEIGVPGMLAPEAAGGLGLTDVDLVLIAEQTGRAALPEPLMEHAGVAVPLLAEFAGSPRAAGWLERAATGEARIAVGPECNPFVLGADRADALLMQHGDEVHLLERDAVTLVPEPSIDTLRSLVCVEWSPSAATRLTDGDRGRSAWSRAFERGALYAAAQCAGLAERMVALSVAYASDRTQFGKLIGSYQALKHHLANVQVTLEFARPVIYAAAARVATAGGRTAAMVSHAKLAAGDAADLAARNAMQVHGAMGYSWEVDLHFYMKRAWALAGTWGDRSFHARRVQSLVLSGAVALGPDMTFSRAGI